MKMFKLLAFLVLMLGIVFGGISMADSKLVKVSKEALDVCAKKYLHQTGDAEGLDKVTHVYVHVSSLDGPFGVMFRIAQDIEGMEEFATVFSCGLRGLDSMEIFFMGAPSSDPIIDSPNAGQIDRNFYDSQVQEVIFLREGTAFKHADTRPLQAER